MSFWEKISSITPTKAMAGWDLELIENIALGRITVAGGDEASDDEDEEDADSDDEDEDSADEDGEEDSDDEAPPVVPAQSSTQSSTKRLIEEL